MGSLVSETGGEYVRARASVKVWRKVIWESGFDYVWKMFLRMADAEKAQEESWKELMDEYGKYLDSRISDPELKTMYNRLINVSAEEEMEMEAKDVKLTPIASGGRIRYAFSNEYGARVPVVEEEKNPNLKKPELKKGEMRKIDVNPDEEFLLEFYRSKKNKESGNMNQEAIEKMQRSHPDYPVRRGVHPHEPSERAAGRPNPAGRKIKWNTPVRPLSEDINNWTSEEGKFTENVDMNDLIAKASFDDLTKPISALGAIDQLACKELLNILEVCKKHQAEQPFPYTVQSPNKVQHEYPLWATLITSESGEGQVANEVIQALMSETMKYNEDRNFDIQGLWDVPKFLEIADDRDIPWASDIAVGISEAHDNKRMVEGSVDWNGRPPPSTRKISVMICLTEASMYEGGEFELITSELKQLKLSIGDVVLWPSFLARRIKPVTKGKLVMLQIFNNGEYFK